LIEIVIAGRGLVNEYVGDWEVVQILLEETGQVKDPVDLLNNLGSGKLGENLSPQNKEADNN
jgi:hypothetical protein